MEEETKGGHAKKRLCGVCGDKALGYNFNAITCESCKAFFRRNALVSKEFKCPFSEQCQITVVTRRFCQKCRLEKCLAIGMVKEYIMSDEDKAQKRKKIAENRAKKRNTEKKPDEEAPGSKLIKREDDDDSTGSWTINAQPSPYGVDENCPVSDQGSHNSDRNQAVSVIKNNGGLAENGVYNGSDDKIDAYLPQYESKCENVRPSPGPSFEHVLSNNMSDNINFNHSVLNNISAMSDKEHNNIIRSILTTTTPGDDTSKLLAALTGSRNQLNQPICENSLATGISGLRHKYDVARDVLQDLERVQMEPKSVKLILCEAIKLEFETYTSHPQANSSSSRELNDAERARLNELIVANKALLAPLDDYMANLVTDETTRFKPTQGQSNPMLLGIINLTAVAIRRLIKMAKKINAFKNMCEEDQVSLLKGGCTEMMILRSTMTYDCARDTWKVPHSKESLSSIKADVLKLAKGNIYQAHDRFVRSFDPKWRTDENIILIMSAIVLFTPTRPRVVHSDVIELEQNCYYYLLRRYLESVYAGCEAKSAFLKLIQKISELQKLAEEVIGVYLDVNPSEVEPLLIEIFDLKQPQ